MSLLSAKHSKGTSSHLQSLALLNDTQCAHLKGLLLDTEASLLNFTECFDFLHAETTPGYRLLDNFPDHIFFHPAITQVSVSVKLTYSLLTIFVLRFSLSFLLLLLLLIQVLYLLDVCKLSPLYISGVWANRYCPSRL